MKKQLIATVGELQKHPSKKFVYENEGSEQEAFLIRFEEAYYAYDNVCPHQHWNLDLGDNEFFAPDGKLLMCQVHAALFLPDSGKCYDGPCYDRDLRRLPLLIEEGKIFLQLGA
ncbi:MAG: Rieske 2Fe-2S domain-containing protein [Candidatus Omnitrophica bacterium]|nr:Rieske 2Fe-2S domain-containing protein [Candidatus Omnitrophota bacterium]